MKYKLLTILIALTCVGSAKPIRISGVIRDAVSKERLIGANVYDSSSLKGTTSDINGYFTLFCENKKTIKVSYIGYGTQIINISASKDSIYNIYLLSDNTLSESVVKAQRRPNFNVNTLNASDLKNIISLGGKTDVLKVTQLMPGITAQNEASSILLVRGGNPGENLYLLDNVPLIYVNHLGGFMSVFNPDMINSMTIYKGGFPAKFGDKLSSIMEITQKEGDKQVRKGSLSIGLTDLSFSLEGPTKLKNSSYLITGRKTFIDPLMYLFTYVSAANNFVGGYGFHDVNGKFTWAKDERNSFSLNVFQGDDYLNFWSLNKKQKGHQGSIWGNWLASASWKHLASSKLFVQNNFSYTRYRLNDKSKFKATEDENNTITSLYQYKSTVQDYTLKSEWKYSASEIYRLDFGLQSSFLTHKPNYTYSSDLGKIANDHNYSFVNSLYADNNLTLGKFEASLGLRFSNYNTQNYYVPSLEPRIKINYTPIENHSFNMSYMKVSQNSHLLFTPGSIMNNEVWVPATKGIAPSISNQISTSWNGSFFDNSILMEVNIYHKTLSNLATFKEGYSNLQGDPYWQSKVISSGTGKAQGVEFSLSKVSGRWTGFANYSYSHATRTFAQINKGKTYLYEFDRPHCFTLNANWALNQKWNLNFTWIFQSGLPYTPIIGRHLTIGTNPDANGNYPLSEVVIYGEMNSARMKVYHRMDIGATYKKTTKRGNRAEWSFSIYNVYNRQNPYYYYLNNSKNAEIYKPGENEGFWDNYQGLSLYQIAFFPFIPTFSYKVYFDASVKKEKRSSSFKKRLENMLTY